MTENKALNLMQKLNPCWWLYIKKFTYQTNMPACLQNVGTKKPLEYGFMILDIGEIFYEFQFCVFIKMLRMSFVATQDVSGKIQAVVGAWSHHSVGQLVISCGCTKALAEWGRHSATERPEISTS